MNSSDFRKINYLHLSISRNIHNALANATVQVVFCDVTNVCTHTKSVAKEELL